MSLAPGLSAAHELSIVPVAFLAVLLQKRIVVIRNPGCRLVLFDLVSLV